MKIPNIIVVAAAIVAGFLYSPSRAAAQEARSFEQLQVLVKPGDTIQVTDFMGRTTKGKVAELSNTVLRFSVNGSTRDLSKADIYRIEQWRGDSLKNGALIGLGVGVGMGAVSMFFCEHGDNSCKVATMGVTAGIYTAVGAGIDALIPSKQTIYFRGTRTASHRIIIKPILQPSYKGAALAYSF